MSFFATLAALVQAFFDIRDALVGLHKIQSDRWSAEGSELTKNIQGDTTDAQRALDAAKLASHLSDT